MWLCLILLLFCFNSVVCMHFFDCSLLLVFRIIDALFAGLLVLIYLIIGIGYLLALAMLRSVCFVWFLLIGLLSCTYVYWFVNCRLVLWVMLGVVSLIGLFVVCCCWWC